MTLACEGNANCGNDFAGVVQGSSRGLRYFCDQHDGCGTIEYKCHGSSETASVDLAYTGSSDICTSARVLCPGEFGPCSNPGESFWSKPQTSMAIAFALCAIFLLACCFYTALHSRVEKHRRRGEDMAIIARFPTVDGDIEHQGFRLGGNVTPSGVSVGPATPGERTPLGEHVPGHFHATNDGEQSGERSPIARESSPEARVGEPS